MTDFPDLPLSRSSSLEDFYGISLVDGTGYSCAPLSLSPPLAPTTSPATSPPLAPLESPTPALQSSPSPPARRSSRAWTPSEILDVVALYKKLGKKFRRIARLTMRSEGAVRGILVRRGFLPPPKKRAKPAVPQERWTAAEDAALLTAIETTPRHERSGDFRWREICKAAGLKRNAHAIRNRAGRLMLEGVVSE